QAVVQTLTANHTSGLTGGVVAFGDDTTNSTPTWSVTPTTALPDGTYDVEVRAFDAAGNFGGITNTPGFTIDTVAPTVVSVNTTAAQGSAHKAGDVITLQVKFSEPVHANGAPRLLLNAGNGAVATFASGNNNGNFTDTLIFTYTAAAGQNT